MKTNRFFYTAGQAHQLEEAWLWEDRSWLEGQVQSSCIAFGCIFGGRVWFGAKDYLRGTIQLPYAPYTLLELVSVIACQLFPSQIVFVLLHPQVNNPSTPNDEGITPLHNAVCAGHHHIVKFLLDFGVNVNAADSDGWWGRSLLSDTGILNICCHFILYRYEILTHKVMLAVANSISLCDQDTPALCSFMQQCSSLQVAGGVWSCHFCHYYQWCGDGSRQVRRDGGGLCPVLSVSIW